ncbi:hypothetical protein BH11VER1_BH11VER1_33970 [soil metagenome]
MWKRYKKFKELIEKTSRFSELEKKVEKLLKKQDKVNGLGKLLATVNRLAELGPKVDCGLQMAADPIKQMTRVRNLTHSPEEAFLGKMHPPDNKLLKVELFDGANIEVKIASLAHNDKFPIPATIDREGYFGIHHFKYWESGLVDYLKIDHVRSLYFGDRPVTLLDLGCATGRFLRHPAAQDSGWTLIGCDIDEMNIDWIKRHMPSVGTVFQNTVFPHLPLPDNSVDIITAFSVFTHVDKLEDSWLLELKRILRPGGILYLTVHTEEVWDTAPQRQHFVDAIMKCRSEWSLPKGLVIDSTLFEKPMPDYAVLRFESAGSYVSQTFHSRRHIERNWSRILTVEGIHVRYHIDFQTVVVMRKPQ